MKLGQLGEVSILTKSHTNWAKIVDFFNKSTFQHVSDFFGPDFMYVNWTTELGSGHFDYTTTIITYTIYNTTEAIWLTVQPGCIM